MSEERIAAFEFDGFIGRVEITADRATLRFYSYWSTDNMQEKPVLSIVCIGPKFDRSAIDSYGDTEVQEVTLYDGRVEYRVWQADDPNRLSCQSAIYRSLRATLTATGARGPGWPGQTRP